ncbi:MAG: HNH endonuclease [Mycoplasma sp.]|nr:HNH endonuclease [Mycoplasma sp.]
MFGVDKEINYFEIINGEIKELKKDIHPWNKNNNNFKDILFSLIKKYFDPDDFVLEHEKNNRYIFFNGLKILDVIFSPTNKGGQKRIKNPKISIPKISNICSINNKYRNFQIEHLVVGIYAPLLIDENNLININSSKLMFCYIEEKELFGRKDSKNNSSRWVSLDELEQVYNLYDDIDIDLSNRKKNIKISTELNFIKLIEKKLSEYDDSNLKVTHDDYLNLIKSNNNLNSDELYKIQNNLIVNQRLRQKFKNDLLKNMKNPKCEFPSCDNKFIDCFVASHIYAVSNISNNIKLNDEQKINMIKDVNNGLLLCPNHDFLFDRYLITFNSKGFMLFSKRIKKYINYFNLHDGQKNFLILSKEKKKYMKLHQEEFNKKNN